MKRFKKVLLTLMAPLMAVILSACGTAQSTQSSQSSQSGASDDKLSVVVSINQWSSMAEEIGGPEVTVETILANQTVGAHDFEPQPADVAKISRAQIVVTNGAEYDAWASKAAANTDAKVVDAAGAAGFKEGANPHAWFSQKARVAAAKEYLAQLKALMPAKAADFDSQFAKWEKNEEALESAITQARGTTDGVKYAATESVAQYVADDLGMVDATPKGYAQATANESEPAPGDIKTFQSLLESGEVKLLFVNAQESNATTEMIVESAKDANVPIVELTESMPKEYTSLTDWVQALVKEITEALAAKE